MAYIAPPINQMSRQDLNTEECVICYEPLYLPSDNGPPVEITTCHHRFHRGCLQTYCGNPANNNNTLIACACPTCQRRFNFNIRLQDLTQQVTDRFAVLDAEDAAAALALAAGPVAGLNPQLQNYLQNNYNIDRIIKEFSNCYSQIIDDAVAFRNDDNIGFDKANYGIQEHLPIPERFNRMTFGNETNIFQQKTGSMHSLVGTMNEIIQKYKFNTAYSIELNNSLIILNTINQNLHDAAFINTLYQPANVPFDESMGLLFIKTSVLYLHATTLKLVASAVNREYRPNLYEVLNEVSPFSQDLAERIIYAFPVNKKDLSNPHYLNLIPLTTTRINGTAIVRPDFQFFIRYFECFVNFVRQLVAINYDVAQQLGGKLRKSRRVKKGRKSRKSRRHNRK